eukprot:625505_1
MYCLICFRGYDSSPLFGCSVRCSLLEQNQQIEIVDGALSIRVLSSCIWIASRHHSSLHICFDDFVYFMSVPCDVFGDLSFWFCADVSCLDFYTRTHTLVFLGLKLWIIICRT